MNDFDGGRLVDDETGHVMYLSSVSEVFNCSEVGDDRDEIISREREFFKSFYRE